jgi:hypothetical protein
LKAVWKFATWRAGSPSNAPTSGAASPINGRAITAPTTRNSKLPSGIRRLIGPAERVSIIGMIPEPMLAPNTKAKASSSGTTPLVAHRGKQQGEDRILRQRPHHALQDFAAPERRRRADDQGERQEK